MENKEVVFQEQNSLVGMPQNELAPTSVWENKDQFNQLLRAAQMLSQTSIVPQSYQGKPQDCFVSIRLRWRT